MSSTAMQVLDELERQLAEYAVSCRADALRRRVSELEAMMSGPGFWDDQAAAQRVIAELKQAKGTVEPHDEMVASIAACRELLELAEGGGDQGEIDEVLAEIADLQQRFEKLEIAQVLDGPYDACDIFLSIQPGAGGTDACDWAEMLVRMYTNYCVNNGYKVELLDHQPAADAGIKSATLQIRGPMAYGYFKSEMGTHRLVRMSPFNSSGTRETSFAAVEVTPELPDADIVDIETMDPKLFRVDTYRSSGAGGQHINKTDSAVRITHLASGIVVSCQTERSQIQNRLKCWKVMQAKLQQLEESERLQELKDLGAERGTIGWGHQIRSYVLQPQQLVTDLRTRLKETNAMGVLDGDLQPFIDSYLRYRLSQRRVAGGRA